MRPLNLAPTSSAFAVLALALGLTLTACAATPEPPVATGLTVVSFNIRNGGRRLDGVYDRPMQQRVLAALKPDLVAMQEVDRKSKRVAGADVPAEFAAALGKDWSFAYAAAMPYDGGEYGTATFSRFPVVRSETAPMPVPGGEPRAASVLTTKIPSGGEVTLVSVHLDSGRKDDARLANARALLARIEKITTPLIVAGDFNDGPDSATLALFVKAGFRRCVPKGDARSHPADKPAIIIDHVLLRDGAETRLEDAGTEVVNEPRASDHRPMLAHLRLTPKR